MELAECSLLHDMVAMADRPAEEAGPDDDFPSPPELADPLEDVQGRAKRAKHADEETHELDGGERY